MIKSIILNSLHQLDNKSYCCNSVSGIYRTVKSSIFIMNRCHINYAIANIFNEKQEVCLKNDQIDAFGISINQKIL